MQESNNLIREDMKVNAVCKKGDTEIGNLCQRLCGLSLAVRRALYPLDCLMKLCGLSYGHSCPLITKIGVKHKIQRAYTITVALVICIATFRYIPLFFVPRSYPTYIHIEYFVWHIKCMVQALYCIYICCRYCRKVSRLQDLIWEYDLQLGSYKNPCPVAERKFLRRSKMILALMFVVLIFNVTLLAISLFSPSPSSDSLHEPLISPLKPTVPVKILFLILTFFFTVSWLLPVVLYCILCSGLCLIFDQFYATLHQLECNSVKKRISYIRNEYNKLLKLSSCTDDLVGFMALCVYLLDVILFCFHMYHLVYYSKDTIGRLAPGFWSFISVCNLFVMSLNASKVVERGQRIYSFVCLMDASDIDLQSHAQLMMLLQDMSIDPPALTVWKLVPLYKSIVISVFVSLITYFTLLIQFKT